MNLTEGADVEFRVRRGEEVGEWKTRLTRATLESVADASPQARWPGTWRTFVAWNPTDKTRQTTAPSKLDEVAVQLELGGISACRATLPLYTGGVLDFTVGQGAPGKDRWAWAFGELKAPKAEEVMLSIKAHGAVKLWIDGKLRINADKAGTSTSRVKLSKGSHVVAARVESGPEQWTLTGRLLPIEGEALVESRCTFDGGQSKRFASLTLVGSGPATLNGRPLRAPLPELIRDHIPGIDPGLLKSGKNVLLQTIPAAETGRTLNEKTPFDMKLLGLEAADAEIAMGPVVAMDAQGRLRVAIVTNATVPAALNINGKEHRSETGLVHSWTLTDLQPNKAYKYDITLGRRRVGQWSLRTLPKPSDPITVAIVGDPQSGKAWQRVAAALKKNRPDMVIIAGDLVVDGLVVTQWQETFLKPAAELLSAVPFRVVPGNHDRYSPLLEKLFAYSGPGDRWQQEVGGALLVGIDGGLDFSPGSSQAKWLDQTLKKHADGLQFVISHYPAYSSRNHGKLAADGRVLEWTSRAARNHIVPILSHRDVAALFGGHDHGYERSELPDGPTMIVSGGGGAGTYPKRESAEKQNPYSKAFGIEHHYSLLKLGRDGAKLTVLTPTGTQIDKRIWAQKPGKEN
ncbi:MAG: metallophosphoesterase [Phycisphaerae bacterium]